MSLIQKSNNEQILFLSCISCTEMIAITFHRDKHRLELMLECYKGSNIDSGSINIFGLTMCKTCEESIYGTEKASGINVSQFFAIGSPPYKIASSLSHGDIGCALNGVCVSFINRNDIALCICSPFTLRSVISERLSIKDSVISKDEILPYLNDNFS